MVKHKKTYAAIKQYLEENGLRVLSSPDAGALVVLSVDESVTVCCINGGMIYVDCIIKDDKAREHTFHISDPNLFSKIKRVVYGPQI